jgi:hypothetical protein
MSLRAVAIVSSFFFCEVSSRWARSAVRWVRQAAMGAVSVSVLGGT